MQSLRLRAQLAFRTMVRRPGTVLVIVVTLAVSLGANAAVFAIVDALVVRPFAFPEVDRIVSVSETRPGGRVLREPASPANFLDWKHDTKTIRQLTAMASREVDLMGGDEPERIQGSAVSTDFFSVIKVQPALGRAFTADEDTVGRDRRVVLSHGLWQRRFAGDPGILGRSVLLDNAPYEVVGIAPQTLDFPYGTELWLPLAFDSSRAKNRSDRSLLVIGRVANGTTIPAAQADMTAIAERMSRDYPEANRGRGIRVQTLTSGMLDQGLGPVLALWQASALIVLLVACANIASLLMARAAERQREVAIRFALGASRWQVITDLSLESVFLGLLSVPFALAIASGALTALRADMPARVARAVAGWSTIGVDVRVAVVTVVLALAASAIFGFLPALQLSRPRADALNEDSRGSVGSVRRQRLRRALIVAQVALIMPLLAASVMSARGTSRFINGSQGYEPAGILTFRLFLSEARFPNEDANRAFASTLLDRMTFGGVSVAAITNVLPSSGRNAARPIEVEGQVATDAAAPPIVDYRTVSPRYFDAMRIRVLRGRGFTEADRQDGLRVAIISTSLAEKYWGGMDPIGHRFRSLTPDGREWITVVGIADDIIQDWFNRRRYPTVYTPYGQSPSRAIALVIRTASEDPLNIAKDVRTAIRAIDPTLPVSDVMSMRQVITERLVGLQYVTVIMLVLGCVALVLAATGIYGLISLSVSQRTHEIGVRMALGATRRDVVWLISGQALRMTMLGVVVGTGLALALAPALEAILVGVASVSVVLLVVLAFALIGTASAAAYVPTRRATMVEPAVALRN